MRFQIAFTSDHVADFS